MFSHLLQIEKLSNDQKALGEVWAKRQSEFSQCLDLQVFKRDSAQIGSWFAKQEVCTASNLVWVNESAGKLSLRVLRLANIVNRDH